MLLLQEIENPFAVVCKKKLSLPCQFDNDFQIIQIDIPKSIEFDNHYHFLTAHNVLITPCRV